MSRVSSSKLVNSHRAPRGDLEITMTRLFPFLFLTLSLAFLLSGCDELVTLDAGIDQEGRGDDDRDRDDDGREDPDCEQSCGERARAAYEACVDEGGDEAECEERAGAAERECLEACECMDDCSERGREMYDDCLEQGGDVADCRESVGTWIQECLDDYCADRPEDDDEDRP